MYQDNGVGGESNANLISFSINGNTYNAEEGMTWNKWMGSNYNTSNAEISGSNLRIPTTDIVNYSDGGYIYNEPGITYVKVTDTIVANYSYFTTWQGQTAIRP